MAKTSNNSLDIRVSVADLAAFRREYTRLAVNFPRESGQAARRLGNHIMRSMRTGLAKGRSGSATAKFSGNWQKLNPLYVFLRGLKSDRSFGGKLAGQKERDESGKSKMVGSPIGYYYDEQGMSLAVGMFRSVPGMRNARRRKSAERVNISASAVEAFQRFQEGGSKAPLDSKVRRAIYMRISELGGGPAEKAMAKREMSRGWNIPPRPMIEKMHSQNQAAWINYLVSQTKRIVKRNAIRGAM